MRFGKDWRISVMTRDRKKLEDGIGEESDACQSWSPVARVTRSLAVSTSRQIRAHFRHESAHRRQMSLARANLSHSTAQASQDAMQD